MTSSHPSSTSTRILARRRGACRFFAARLRNLVFGRRTPRRYRAPSEAPISDQVARALHCRPYVPIGRQLRVGRERFNAAVSDGAWPEDEGKEVMHLFRGTAAALDGRLDDADRLQRSLADKSPYARAYLGLGGLPYSEDIKDVRRRRQTRGTSRNRRSLPFRVRRHGPSREFKRRGEGPSRNCPNRDLPIASRFRALVVRGKCRLKIVLDEFEAGNVNVRELAAEAQGELGLIHLPAMGDNDTAREFLAAAAHYRAASDLTELPERRAFFLGRLGWVMDELGDELAAREAYENAAASSESAGDYVSRDRYRALVGRVGGAVMMQLGDGSSDLLRIEQEVTSEHVSFDSLRPAILIAHLQGSRYSCASL